MRVIEKDRLIVALDVPTAAEANSLVERLTGAVGMFKVGSQLFTAAGPDFVRSLVGRGHRVFLDLKYHDIPNTVAHAVAEAARLGVSLATLHALGGREMLAAAVAAKGSSTRLLAITVLTSHDDESLARVGVTGGLVPAVRRLALLAREAGIDGVVASPQEVAAIRDACGPELLIVTPGVRPAGAQAGDQARPATPSAARAAGADYLVVGRPVIGAPDPLAAVRAILGEMEGTPS